ncbi:MAG: YihY/virulence factor BrkB family protein [Proteobacteria bacterium]|nr:YihY/virulence factor BrkB family protein [Pseudomonadota bacterium]
MRLGRLLAVLTAGGSLASRVARKLRRRPHDEPDADARGRYARSPLEMTARGWRDVLLRSWYDIFEDRLLSVAAGAAFFGLMAVVPGLAVLTLLFGLFSDGAKLELQLAPLFELMPASAAELVLEQARRLAGQSSDTLSTKLVASLAIAIWSANAGIKAMFDALNVAYGEAEQRSFLWLNTISLLTTFCAALLLIIMLLLTAVLPAILHFLPFPDMADEVFRQVRWPLFLVLATLSIAMLYWIGPCRRKVRFRWVLPGAIIAALLWALVSWLFSFYVTTLGNYQVTYGSLSAVIVFMTWLWLSAFVILLGAEINAQLEHQTLIDTSNGKAPPTLATN